MKSRLAVVAVLLLVVASLLVAGCTTSTTSNTNQTPTASATPSTATHDAFLEKYLAAFKNVTYADKNLNIKAWELTWINSTSARLEWAQYNKTLNTTASYVGTYIVFPTPQDATNYLNAMNKTAYSLASTQYPTGGAYQKVTGHAPQIYKDYVWNEGNPFNLSEYQRHEISQLDNIISTYTGKQIS